jgi:hypothetical protein
MMEVKVWKLLFWEISQAFKIIIIIIIIIIFGWKNKFETLDTEFITVW